MSNIRNGFAHGFEFIANEVEKRNKEFVYNIWDQLMIRTPVDTGTLRVNWRVAPGESGGTYKKQYPEPYSPNHYSKPEKPNLDKYKRNWKQFRIYNNTPYIMQVEENNYAIKTAKTNANANFIKDSVDAAVAMMK